MIPSTAQLVEKDEWIGSREKKIGGLEPEIRLMIIIKAEQNHIQKVIFLIV